MDADMAGDRGGPYRNETTDELVRSIVEIAWKGKVK